MPDLDSTESRLLQERVNVCRFNEILEAAKKAGLFINKELLMGHLDAHQPLNPEVRIGIHRPTIGLPATVDMVHSDLVRDQKIPKTACPAKPSMRGML